MSINYFGCLRNGSPVYVHNSSDVKWYEIDDEDDLKFAENEIVKGI